MLTPNNESGDKTDKIMLLAIWADTLRKEGTFKSLISAGMGKPTYPVNINTVQMFLNYWQDILEKLQSTSHSSEADRANTAIDYGDPRGDIDPKQMMAKAMTRWYGTEIQPDNILFTVGGAGALRIIFETLNDINKDIPAYRVITPFPHYPLYSDNRHQLHPVEVFNQPGYRLTAQALQKSINEAYELAKKDNNKPKCVLFCNPNNPLGTVITEQEWAEIIPVLRRYPDLKILIDEAYTEMSWSETKIPALIKMAPDLKKRVIMLRSATKAHSAAGERMAVLMAFDKGLMAALVDKNIGVIGHAPRSAQAAYAYTMDKFGEKEVQALRNYYKPKVDYVADRLRAIGAGLPDQSFHIDGTFYVMADLSDLLGMEIPKEAKRALGKTGKITTSEDLAYSLLFDEALMIAPGEYFGLPKNKGYVRITCSGSDEELHEMVERIELVLLNARKMKHDTHIDNILNGMEQLKSLAPELHHLYLDRVSQYLETPSTCKDYILRNLELEKLASDIKISILRITPEGQDSAARTIQSFFRKVMTSKHDSKEKNCLEEEWLLFVDQMIADGPIKNYFLNLSPKERLDIKLWAEYLQQEKPQKPQKPHGFKRS